MYYYETKWLGGSTYPICPVNRYPELSPREIRTIVLDGLGNRIREKLYEFTFYNTDNVKYSKVVPSAFQCLSTGGGAGEGGTPMDANPNDFEVFKMGVYPVTAGETVLDKATYIEYEDGNKVNERIVIHDYEEFEYEDRTFHLLVSTTSSNSNGVEDETIYRYVTDILPSSGAPDEASSDNAALEYYQMFTKFGITRPIEVINLRDGNVVGGGLSTYQVVGNDEDASKNAYMAYKTYTIDLVAPASIDDMVLTSINQSSSTWNLSVDEDFYGDPKFRFDFHPETKLLIETEDYESGIIESVVYGDFNDNSGYFPLVTATGVDYTTLSSAVEDVLMQDHGEVLQDIHVILGYIGCLETPGEVSTWRDFNESLRGHPDLIGKPIITTLYKPSVGLISQVDANGRETRFEYDQFGRLTTTRDHEGNIVSHQAYQYKN